MDNIAKTLAYKIETRKFAQAWLGLEMSKEVNQLPAEVEDKIEQLSALIDEARRNSTITSYYPIISARRVLGRFIVFTKKVIRKLIHIFLKWYIDPILNRQSFFNIQMTELVQLSKELLERHERSLDNLQEQLSDQY